MGLWMECSKGAVVFLMMDLEICFLDPNHMLYMCMRTFFYLKLIMDDVLAMGYGIQV